MSKFNAKQLFIKRAIDWLMSTNDKEDLNHINNLFDKIGANDPTLLLSEMQFDGDLLNNTNQELVASKISIYVWSFIFDENEQLAKDVAKYVDNYDGEIAGEVKKAVINASKFWDSNILKIVSVYVNSLIKNGVSLKDVIEVGGNKIKFIDMIIDSINPNDFNDIDLVNSCEAFISKEKLDEKLSNIPNFSIKKLNTIPIYKYINEYFNYFDEQLKDEFITKNADSEYIENSVELKIYIIKNINKYYNTNVLISDSMSFYNENKTAFENLDMKNHLKLIEEYTDDYYNAINKHDYLTSFDDLIIKHGDKINMSIINNKSYHQTFIENNNFNQDDPLDWPLTLVPSIISKDIAPTDEYWKFDHDHYFKMNGSNLDDLSKFAENNIDNGEVLINDISKFLVSKDIEKYFYLALTENDLSRVEQWAEDDLIITSLEVFIEKNGGSEYFINLRNQIKDRFENLKKDLEKIGLKIDIGESLNWNEEFNLGLNLRRLKEINETLENWGLESIDKVPDIESAENKIQNQKEELTEIYSIRLSELKELIKKLHTILGTTPYSIADKTNKLNSFSNYEKLTGEISAEINKFENKIIAKETELENAINDYKENCVDLKRKIKVNENWDLKKINAVLMEQKSVKNDRLKFINQHMAYDSSKTFGDNYKLARAISKKKQLELKNKTSKKEEYPKV